VTTVGREAHSSTPQKGRNAIYDMTRVISALRRVPPGKFEMDGFSGVMPINVALIEGGRALNIVPGECKITCERRVFPNEKPEQIIRSIKRAVEGVKGVDARVEFGGNVQPPYIVEKSHEVVKLAVDSAKQAVGYKPKLRIGLGRTDSMYLFHMAGIKTVIMGPGHTGHVIGESINIDRLAEFTEILGNMLKPEA
jgi:acetylornithine deacetylase/succinyl-diaminopimelate desuccinylase-like protein